MTPKPAVLALIALACLTAGACGTDDGAGTAPTTTAGSDDTVSPGGEGSATPQTFTEADTGKEVQLAVGEEVLASLERCVGCGYQWKITEETDAAIVESLGSTNEPRTSDTQPGDPPLLGGPSDEVFRFRGVAGGSTKVTIGYFPPTGDTPDETFTLSFVVT